ncbi:hypothetical protein ACH5RR_034341 [Cinchona calisaya]|uniref:Leucine-rich repeat-containing N-terminal plant-type domain-containing protein n=1 Tax=Cinchona calisaya TaxID=153742 RepID=A0ABD2YBD4_9GENT
MKATAILLINVYLLSTFQLTNAASSKMHANAVREEGKALLVWKVGLDNNNQLKLSSWSALRNPCTNWIGIRCNKVGKIAIFNVTSFGIKGIPNHLNFSSFPHLTTIEHFDNALYGSIPPNIGNLSELIYLSLPGNHFSGVIPIEICKLTTLRHLILFNNSFHRPIPQKIGLLSSLVELDLGENELTGNPHIH